MTDQFDEKAQQIARSVGAPYKVLQAEIVAALRAAVEAEREGAELKVLRVRDRYAKGSCIWDMLDLLAKAVRTTPEQKEEER